MRTRPPPTVPLCWSFCRATRCDVDGSGLSVPITSPATPIPDVAERLRQIVTGWRGAERGETLADLHRACRNAAGPNSRAFLPEQVLAVDGLDAQTLQAALDSQHGPGRNGLVRFRVQVVGRFDAALVPVGPAGEACDIRPEMSPSQSKLRLRNTPSGHLDLACQAGWPTEIPARFISGVRAITQV